MSDCFVLYLLLTCMKKKTSGADKFTNNSISCVGEFPKYKACFLEQHDYADISWSSDVEVWNPPAWDTTEGNITGDIKKNLGYK